MEQADQAVSVFLVLFGLAQSTISGKTINQPMTLERFSDCQSLSAHIRDTREGQTQQRALWLERGWKQKQKSASCLAYSGSTISSDISGGQLFEQSADGSSYRVSSDGQQRSCKDQYKSRYKINK